jgi:hypothetical protein
VDVVDNLLAFLVVRHPDKAGIGENIGAAEGVVDRAVEDTTTTCSKVVSWTWIDSYHPWSIG